MQQLMLQISVFQSFPPILNNLMLSILLCCNSSVLNDLQLLLKEVVPLFDHHHGPQHREKPDTTKTDQIYSGFMNCDLPAVLLAIRYLSVTFLYLFVTF